MKQISFLTSYFFTTLFQKIVLFLNIEFWGLDELQYNKRKEIKKSFYKKYKKNLIELTDKDVENLDDIMPIKLRPYLPPTSSFN